MQYRIIWSVSFDEDRYSRDVMFSWFFHFAGLSQLFFYFRGPCCARRPVLLVLYVKLLDNALRSRSPPSWIICAWRQKVRKRRSRRRRLAVFLPSRLPQERQCVWKAMRRWRTLMLSWIKFVCLAFSRPSVAPTFLCCGPTNWASLPPLLPDRHLPLATIATHACFSTPSSALPLRWTSSTRAPQPERCRKRVSAKRSLLRHSCRLA